MSGWKGCYMLLWVGMCFTSGHSWFLDSPFLVGKDLQFNQHDFDLTNSVSTGAHIGIAECAFQFKHEKWNCPEQAFYLHTKTTATASANHRPNIRINSRFNFSSQANSRFDSRSQAASSRTIDSSNIPAAAESRSFPSRNRKEISNDKGHLNLPPSSDSNLAPVSKRRPSNRETAFIHAITSAGITHTLTKNCSSGDFGDCGCDSRLTKRQFGWKWGGCSDNFHFGSQVAREFLDAMETGFDPASMANLHNNEAGRVAVRKKMRRLCKCHGVSGSCTTQTCWSTLSDFRLVGSFVKRMYNQALRVDYDVAKGQLDRADNLIRNQLSSTSATSPNSGQQPLRSSRSSRSHEAFKHDDDQLRTNSDDPDNFKRPSRSHQGHGNLRRPSRSSRGHRTRTHSSQQSDQLDWLSTNSDEHDGLARPSRSSQDQGQGHGSADQAAVPSGRLVRYQQKEVKIKKRHLVFLQESPNYCHGHEGGVESVLARKCVIEPGNPKSQATVKTCSKLCRKCGFKVIRKEVEVLSSCNCRFQWCCQVTCETCKMKRVEITCSL